MKVISRRLAGAILLAALVATPSTALAQAPSNIGSYVSYGYGTGVHTIGGSSAFPNFQNGAVNNHYPLAQVEQDASPASAARATFSDSGPLAATAVQLGLQRRQPATSAERLPEPEQPGSVRQLHLSGWPPKRPCRHVRWAEHVPLGPREQRRSRARSQCLRVLRGRGDTTLRRCDR